MNNRILTTIFLTAAALAACTDTEPAPDSVSAAGKTRVVLKQEQEQARPIAVYAFRQQGEDFLFDTLFRDGWTPRGTLSVRMPNGRYKFLFASGSGEILTLEPAPLTPGTNWDEVAFEMHPKPEDPSMWGSADELFLQYPASDANRVYILGGSDQTVPARLTRAVSRIDIHLKRGYHDGVQYVEVPYTAPHSILEEIERVELRAENAGLRVTPDAVSGSAAVEATLAAADYVQLTETGFATLEGPLILPPAGGADLDLTVEVVPVEGAGLQPVRLDLWEKVERNEILDVTLWITAGYPVVGVEIGYAPIDRKQDGDSGIWE
ncbi:hypothetical protein [Alistipes sp.]|uniref:hypothetical protein n=1 Tax=Alistipes sp. TaxID=1872444 RepID=UPI003AEF72E3